MARNILFLIKKNTIFVLNNNIIIKTINLYDPNYLRIVCERADIFVVYNGYVVNLAGDINKKILFDSKFNFISKVNDVIYIKDKDNMIISNKVWTLIKYLLDTN